MNQEPTKQFKEIYHYSEQLNISPRSIRKWINEGKICEDFIQKKISRGSKGFTFKIHPMGLPEPYRTKYITDNYEPESNEVQLKLDNEAYDRAPGWAKEYVELWISLIQQFGVLRGKELKNAIAAYREANPSQKVSLKSFYRNQKKYKEEGIAGLIPKYGNRKGATILHPDDFIQFCSQYLRESRPTPQTCWELTLGIAWKSRGIKKEDFPSPKTFIYQLEKQYTPAFIYYCRYGKEAYNKKYADYNDRDKSDILANSCWVGDHRQLDILLVDPKTGKSFRPWVTAWMDFKTNKIISYELYNGNPNSDRIFQTFKWGIEKYGRPYESIYIDNGKDYRSLDFAGGTRVRVDEIKTRTLVNRLGIKALFSLPYNAQTKNIERIFKEFIEFHEKHLPGYTGAHHKARPEDTKQREKKKDFMTFEVFREQFDRFIFEVHNKRSSQGKELQGRSPDEAFFSEYQQKIAVRAEALHLLCMRSSKAKTIGRNGIKDKEIGESYYADWMMGYKGVKVYIRRDPKNYQEAWVYNDVSDEFMGTAYIDPKTPGFANTPEEKEILTAKQARKNREFKLLEESRKLHAANQLGHKDLIDAQIASIEADKEMRRKRGEFEEYDEQVANYVMDTTEMDEAILKDERMKRTGTESIEEFMPPEPAPKKRKLKSIFDD